jgi:hypothetical protein
MMTSLKQNIEAYVLAKDANWPHLFGDVLPKNAALSKLANASDFEFPPRVHGREAIGLVLERQFGAQRVNVCTFFLSGPSSKPETFVCDWFGSMTRKINGATRSEFGKYDWIGDLGLMRSVPIAIEQVRVLDKEISSSILVRARTHPYPCCTSKQPQTDVPEIDALQRAECGFR